MTDTFYQPALDHAAYLVEFMAPRRHRVIEKTFYIDIVAAIRARDLKMVVTLFEEAVHMNCSSPMWRRWIIEFCEGLRGKYDWKFGNGR